MGFFNRISSYIKQMKIPKKSPAFSQNENVLKLLDLKKYIDSLLASDKYIAKSDYLAPIKQYRPTIDFFDILKNSGMLADFCQRNGISLPEVQNTTAAYTEIEKRVDQLNEEFITKSLTTEKEYLDNILKSVDPAVSLDDDQRRVVLTDEDYCLIIAGAGAGKTTTVAAKVKYLVDRQGIKPSQILVVSFTNKAVNELKEKIQSALGIPCPIATFHSTGNAIIHVNAPEEKLNIVDNSRLYFVIRDYFRGSVMQNESIVNKLIMFFASYFDAPYEGDDFNAFFNNIAKANYSTMRSDLEDFKCQVIDARTKKSVTIQNEVLRSHQEVEIANFLYLNNIDYDYEPAYPYNIAYARKPYTPDFIICQDGKTAYIEHFGISQSGENDRYSPEELDRYKKAVNNKVRLHRQHGTTLIYTFSSYNDRKPLLAHLREELEAKGFELRPRSNKEVMESLVAGEENRYIRKLINLICRFISNFKVNGYTEDEFGRMYHSTQNVRSRLFLDICNDCYLEYARWLRENKAVDFEDMINESARILTEVKEMKQKLDFKYIIVDEYQDISRQRFDLTKALSEVTDAKIIAVGDDWQSIYAFSGSDITLFTKFAEKMGYAKMLKIVRTYRNSQEVIDIAGNFIQRNSQQIPKQLVSPKRIEDPVVIYTYDSTFKGRDGNRRSGANYALASAVETAIGQLLEYKKKENKEPGPILFLGRFGFDGDHLERSGLFEYSSRGSKIKSVKYPKLDITFMTAHSSKGLGYDDVILLGCTNYNRNGTGCNNVVNKKLFYDQMGYEMEEAEAACTEKTAVVWKSPNRQAASTLSASQSAPQSTADRRLEDDSIEIVLADIPPVMHGNYELNHLIFTVVKALQNISRVRYYGATVLAEVLKGTDSKKIFDSKLDKLPEFGALRDMPYDTIKSVIDWMIAEHLILKTKGKYPVLHSTHEGLHYSEVMTEGKLKGLKKYLEGEAIV